MSRPTPSPWRVPSPGPWRVAKYPEAVYPGLRAVLGPSFNLTFWTQASDLTTHDAWRRIADGNLIAAAPDLLAALDEVTRLYAGAEDAYATRDEQRACNRAMPEAMDRAYAAIAKAQGDTP